MSIGTKFESFCSNILIAQDTVEDISYRYKRITKQLNKDFWETESETAHSLYVGSYGRDTDIHVSDVDMLFQLPYAVYERISQHSGNGQSALLQEVKSSIENTYKSYVRADGQVVKVDFTDGVSFEIIPCFINKDDISYTYPDTNDGGTWKITNPRAEIKAIKEANDIWNGNLKRLCRMARAWKETWEVPIGGLLIDTLAYNYLSSWGYRDKSLEYYDWMVRGYFTYLKDMDENKSYWLAPGSGTYVLKQGDFNYKALRCYNIALQAIEHETNHNEYSANQSWKEIFGPKFTT